MASIPGNKMQEALKRQQVSQRAPTPYNDKQVFGEIVQVYDQSYFDNGGEVDPPTAAAINAAPGELVVAVKLEATGQTMPFSIGLAEDAIKTIFGNAPLLLKRRVRITYKPGRLSAGDVTILPKRYARKADLVKKTAVADIGGIL